MIRICLTLAAALTAAGCTQSERASKAARFGDTPADVTCRSYGQLLYQGRTTGEVEYDEGGRITFVDAASGRLTTIEGECVVVYDRPRPTE